MATVTRGVDERTVRSLLANPAALAAAPELRAAVGRPRPDPYCPPCRLKKWAASIDYARARQVLAGLSGAKLAAVKRLLAADRLVLAVPTPSGRTHVVTV